MRFSKKVVCDGITFDSETEQKYYLRLKILKKHKIIKDFSLQVPYLLQEDYKNFEKKKINKVEHIIDFKVTLPDGQEILIDTKGFPEEDAKLKKKWFMYQYNIPYYWIALLPKYLGGFWCRIDTGCDFRKKIKNKYTKEYGKYKRGGHQITPPELATYFEYENFHELFCQWKSTKRKKKKGN